MSQMYTTATAVSSNEVKIHFRCAKCGREVTLTRYLNYSDERTASGYEALKVGDEARASLISHVLDDFREDVEDLKRNKARLYMTKDVGMNASPGLHCPGCGVNNIPDAGCERRVLTPDWIKRKPQALVILLAVVLVIGIIVSLIGLSGGNMSATLDRSTELKAFLVPVFVLALIIALGVAVNRILSKKAYNNPKLMAWLYNSVPNREVYADLTPYGFGEIHIGSQP